MIGKRNKVKKAGDERLLRIVAQLQRQLAEQKVFDQTTGEGKRYSGGCQQSS